VRREERGNSVREWGRRSDGEDRVWRKEGRGVMGDGRMEKGKELVRGVIREQGEWEGASPFW